MPERTATALQAVPVHVFVEPADIGDDAPAFLAHELRLEKTRLRAATSDILFRGS